MRSQRDRAGILHAFDAALTTQEIEERWGIVLELGELICEETEVDGRRFKVFRVYLR